MKKRCESERKRPVTLARTLLQVDDPQLVIYSRAAEWEAARDPGSDVFRGRCREAAAVAHQTAKMARERERVGFVPLSFGQYVQLLSRLAGTGVDALVRWAGLDPLSELTVDSATGLARMARSLGMDLRQALAHLRLSFAGEVLGVPVAVVSRGRTDGSAPGNSLEESEASLASLERALDEEHRQVLGSMMAEFRRVYGETMGKPKQ